MSLIDLGQKIRIAQLGIGCGLAEQFQYYNILTVFFNFFFLLNTAKFLYLYIQNSSQLKMNQDQFIVNDSHDMQEDLGNEAAHQSHSYQYINQNNSPQCGGEIYYEESNYQHQVNIPFDDDFIPRGHLYHTDAMTPDRAREFVTREWQTAMTKKVDTKNIPKTFGNNFKKYCDKLRNKPRGIEEFCSLKAPGKQAQYALEDFRKLFRCPKSVHIFQHYVKNELYLDLLHSNRIQNPSEYINFIEQYLAGSKNPDKFISSRRHDQPYI